MDEHLENGLAIALGLHYNNIRWMISRYNYWKDSAQYGATATTFNTAEGVTCPDITTGSYA